MTRRLTAIFFVINAVIVTVGRIAEKTIFPSPCPPGVQCSIDSSTSTDLKDSLARVLFAGGIVIAILVVDVIILAALKKIGGPLRADVQAELKKSGGKVTIVSVGLIGSFLAIAIVAYAAVIILTSLIHSN